MCIYACLYVCNIYVYMYYIYYTYVYIITNRNKSSMKTSTRVLESGNQVVRESLFNKMTFQLRYMSGALAG